MAEEKIKLYFVSTSPFVELGEKKLQEAWLVASGAVVAHREEAGPDPWQKLRDELSLHGLFGRDKASHLSVFLTEYNSSYIQSEILSLLPANGFQENAPMFSILLELIKGGARLYGVDDSDFMILKNNLRRQANWGQEIDPKALQRALEFRHYEVAKHIDAKVHPGELALLFVSTAADQMLHSEPFQEKFDITEIQI